MLAIINHLLFVFSLAGSLNNGDGLLEKQNSGGEALSYQAPSESSYLERCTAIRNVEKEKLYCSSYLKTKYRIAISGSKIKITRLYKEYTDVFHGNVKN